MATETFNYDNLNTGRLVIATSSRTLVSGQNLTRGTVLGKITASGKYQIWDTGVATGAEIPYAILHTDCDASGGDATCTIYTFGEFNEEELTLNQALTDAYRDNLRDVGIYLVTAIRN